MKKEWKAYPFEHCLEAVPRTTKLPSSKYLEKGTFPVVSQEDTLISGYWDNEEDVLRIAHPIVIFGDHTRIIKYIDFDFVIGADGVKVLSPIDELVPKFLYYYLRWVDVPSLGYSRHYKLLKETTIPVPPIPEQERIVAELDLLSGIIDKYKQQLKELDALAQSIFYDMFGDPEENNNGWEEVALETLCSVITKGTTPTTIGYQFVDEGISFVKVESFTKDEEIDTSKVVHITEECHNAMRRSALEEDDILICIAGATIGRLAKVPKSILPANTNQAFAIIRLKNEDKSFHSFIYAFLHSSYIQRIIYGLKKGVAQPNLSLAQVRAFKIVLPPMDIQISFADRIKAIEVQKKAINQAIIETEALFNSRMDYYFN